ncbi:hypothetical protein A1O7_03690, partial [Cladophialophora yegresii CBS 114405]
SPPPSPRSLLSRSYQSEPIPIRQLPNSASLLCGPRLSPPPPARFRLVEPSLHFRARSEPFAPHAPRTISHSRTQSFPPSVTQPHIDQIHHAEKLRDSDHCDRSVRVASAGGLCNLRNPKSSEPVCEEGEGSRRGGGRRRVTASQTVRARARVRFQLDDDDLQQGVPAKNRSVSGILRLEDDADYWF